MEDRSQLLIRQGRKPTKDEEDIDEVMAGLGVSDLLDIENELKGASKSTKKPVSKTTPVRPELHSGASASSSTNPIVSVPKNASVEVSKKVNSRIDGVVAAGTETVASAGIKPLPSLISDATAVTAAEEFTKDPIEYVSKMEMMSVASDPKTLLTQFEISYPTIFGSQAVASFARQTHLHCDVMRDGCILLGTSRGEVLRFSKKEADPLILNDPSQQLGSVTCIDVRDTFVLVGYSEGAVGLFSLKKRQLVLPPFKDIHKTIVLSVKFFDDVGASRETVWDSLQDVRFLSSDRLEVKRTHFTKGLFSGYKANSENYPDLFECTDIVKRYQRQYHHSSSVESLSCEAITDPMVFRNAFYIRTYDIIISKKPAQLLILVTQDSIVILAESSISRPMLVYNESRKSERFASVSADQIATVELLGQDILLVQWGCTILVTQLRLAFTQQNQELCITNTLPNSTRFYTNDSLILSAGCIRSSILFLIDAQNTCHILNYKKFAKAPYVYAEDPEQSNQAHIFKSHHLSRITNYQLIKNLPTEVMSTTMNNFIKSYAYSVQILDDKIYILANDNSSGHSAVEIQEGEILRWEYQLDLKFATNSQTVTSHITTLELCLQIHNGSNKSFGDVSTFKEKLREYICKKTKECFEVHVLDMINTRLDGRGFKRIKDLNKPSLDQVEFLLKENETFDESVSEEVVMKFMKFLVCTSSWEFLFTPFYTAVASLGKKMRVEFVRALVPFIEMSMITSMPSEQVFLDLVKAADKAVPLTTVNKLILNLNMAEQNFAFILNGLKNNQESFFTPYTYLVTRIDSDFQNPLKIMMSSYTTLPNANERNATPTLNRQYIGYRILWFIRMSLSGLLFPGEQMDNKKWVNASNQVFKWIFLDGNLKKLLAIDADIAFQNLLMFFRGYSSQIISEQSSVYAADLRQRLKESSKTSAWFANGGESNLKSLIVEMIYRSLPSSETQSANANSSTAVVIDTLQYFYLFLGEIKDVELTLDNDLAERAALFLLKNPNAHLFKHKDLVLELEGKCRQIVKLIQPCIAAKKLDLEEFLRTALNSPFVEVCSYIYKLRGDYKSAIRVFLEAEMKEIQLKVFAFLRELLEKQPASFTQRVFDQILHHLPKLVELDHERTNSLLKLFKQADIRTLLSALAGSNEQLSFLLLRDFFKDLQRPEDNVAIVSDEDSQYFVDYIKLMAKYDKPSVLNQLKKSLFNQDKVMEGLKSMDHLEGRAYLYQCMGDHKSAIETYLKLVKEALQNRKEAEARSQFNIALDLLRRTNKIGDDECENLWFFWITGIQRLESELISGGGVTDDKNSNKKSQAGMSRMLEVQRNFEDDTFQDLINHVQVSSILENRDLLPVLSSTDSFDARGGRKKQLETLAELLHSFSFEMKTFEYSKDIMYAEYKRLEHQNFKIKRRGFKMSGQCDGCEDEFEDHSEIRRFMCGHTFCRTCTRTYCQKCFETEGLTVKGAVFQSIWENIKTANKDFLKEEQEKEQTQSKASSAQKELAVSIEQKKATREELEKKKLMRNRQLKKLEQHQKKVLSKVEYIENEDHYQFLGGSNVESQSS